MLGFKVSAKNAQKAKKFLIDKGVFAKDYYLKKEEGNIIFPIIEKIGSELGEVIESDFSPINRDSMRTILKKDLTDEEYEKLKTAYDLIGDIAILEIDKDLQKKEKVIAQALLKTHKQIRTVVKKAGIHDGTFRTQPVTYLAGENKTEALYGENSTKLLLDVGKIYFSPRLSTERKRIAEQVKPGEDILCMFSGAGPYPLTLSKNTQARHITGIEINPLGFQYSQKNKVLNKISNVSFIQGDVNNIVPNLMGSIIGLKTSIKEKPFSLILDKKPKLVELWTREKNYTEDEKEGFWLLRERINTLIRNDIDVIVHQPLSGEKPIDMTQASIKHPIFSKMIELADLYPIELVIHLNNEYHDLEKSEELKAKVIRNIRTFEKYYSRINFENPNEGYLSRYEDVIEIIKETALKKVCVDTCHYMHHYSVEELPKIIMELQNHASLYFHLADYKDGLHGGPINDDSLIKIDKLIPYINKGLAEISCKDHDKHTEMLDSWEYIRKFEVLKTFDRILMPLPKSAEDFLDLALSVSKPGSIIHFYDFLHKDKFHEAEEKIAKACKRNDIKYEILSVNKCGQHAPYTFRICVDFVIR